MVTASRNWVCVRPATYESASEAEVLLGYFGGRGGQLENTVFALLDHEGELISRRAGRSPSMLYDSPAELAAALSKGGKAPKKSEQRALPELANLRLAMNVAACDSLPLVVAYGPEGKGRERLEQQLATAAWGETLVGEVHYVVCAPADLDEFEALARQRGTSQSGLLVVDPDDYGREGEVLASIDPDLKPKQLSAQLVEAVDEHHPLAREHRRHVRDGKRKGLEWKGQIPTSDPDERRRR